MLMVQTTAKDLVKALSKAGYSEIRVTGDHHIFKDKDGTIVSVPYSRQKDTVSKGVVSQIRRLANLK